MRHLKRLGLFGTVMLAVLGVGVAFAAWTATGGGNGYAKAKTAVVLHTDDVTASAATTAQLYPNGSGDVKINIVNDNDYGIDVLTINGNGPITSDKGANCNGSTGVTYTNQSGTWHVNAHAAQTFTLVGAVAMSNASHNDCQGAIFTIPVTLAGLSNP